MLIETSDELTTLGTVEKLLKDNDIKFSLFNLDIPNLEDKGSHEVEYYLLSRENKEKLYELIMELCKRNNILEKSTKRLGYSNEIYLDKITESKTKIEKTETILENIIKELGQIQNITESSNILIKTEVIKTSINEFINELK